MLQPSSDHLWWFVWEVTYSCAICQYYTHTQTAEQLLLNLPNDQSHVFRLGWQQGCYETHKSWICLFLRNPQLTFPAYANMCPRYGYQMKPLNTWRPMATNKCWLQCMDWIGMDCGVLSSVFDLSHFSWRLKTLKIKETSFPSWKPLMTFFNLNGINALLISDNACALK